MHGCSDDVLLALLNANKSAASANDHNGCFLLQRVIQAKCSSKLILAVLQANTDAAKCQVSLKGSILPLIYYAIEEGCSDDVLLALLNANISAAKIKDRFGSSLLQRVIDSKHSSDLILAVLHAWL